jgi:hypothetical protein
MTESQAARMKLRAAITAISSTELSLLWIGGIAALLVGLGSKLIPFQGERLEWAEYILLGVGLPTFVAAVSRFGSRHPYPVQFVLLLGLPTIFFTNFVEQIGPGVLAASAASLLGAFALWGLRQRFSQSAAPLLAALLASLISWAFASRLLWWGDWQSSITASLTRFAIFASGLLLTLLALRPSSQETATRDFQRVVHVVVRLAALLSFALASTRVDYDLDESIFVGSAELVRQGGQLLWDVPSQYGFLSILTLAVAPLRTTWQAVYAVNSLFLFLSALAVFFVFSRFGRSYWNLLFAWLITFAAVFLMPGYAMWLTGPNRFPNVGGFRFFWCYLLFVIVLECCRATRAGRSHAPFWLAGCFAWVLGVLWSCESGVFSSAIWGFPFLLMVWRRYGASRKTAAWLVLPLLLLAAAVGLISAVYVRSFGHLPDWHGYFEYAVAYQQGFNALPISADGSVWVLVLSFCGILSLFAAANRREPNTAPVLLAAASMLWATSSYFVSRSHENNIGNLTPLYLTSLGGALVTTRYDSALVRASWLVRLTMVPIAAVVFSCTFGNVDYLADYWASLTRSRAIERIHEAVPGPPPELIRLLRQSGARDTDAYAVYAETVFPTLSDEWAPIGGRYPPIPRFWLPLAPGNQLGTLSLDRQRTYVERFLARSHGGGWVIIPRDIFLRTEERIPVGFGQFVPNPSVFRPLLLSRFRMLFSREDGSWRVERWAPL